MAETLSRSGRLSLGPVHILPVPGSAAQTPGGLPRVHPARRCSRGVPGAPGEGRASRTDRPPVPCGQPAGGQGARCEREQHVAPPARVHPDLYRLWLGFVPWPRRGRQGNVACAGPTRLSGPGAAGGCRLWCGVLSPHGLPECALSLLDLFAPPGQHSVATAPHPARDADGQAPGHLQGCGQEDGASGAPEMPAGLLRPMRHRRAEGRGAGRPGWRSTLFCPSGTKPL